MIFSHHGMRNPNPTKNRTIRANKMQTIILLALAFKGMICWVWIEVVLKSHRMSDSPPKAHCRPLQNAHPPECFAECAFSLVPQLILWVIRAGLFFSFQSFFSRPPFDKTDRAGTVSTLHPLFFNLYPFGSFNRRSEALCFAETNHTAFRSVSQSVFSQRKNCIKFSKTIRIFFFFLCHR